MVTKRSGLIFIIVLLALTPLGRADFQIGTRYLDDSPFNPDTDILDLDESLYLSAYTDEVVSGHMGGYDWALVCDWSLATITGGEAGPDATLGVMFWGSASFLWEIPYSVPENEDGQWGVIGGEYFEPGLYLDKFLYSPMAVGDVTVRFLRLDSGTGWIITVPDSIVIRQIPEPMTIALLGLGGLFLLRRRICLK